MPKIRFHKLAAIVVLIGFAAWMGTGEFSSVGSVAANKAKAAEVEQGKAPDAEQAEDGRSRAEGTAAHRRGGDAAAQDLCARHPHFRA